MGKKSAPACHLVKHHIGKATLSPQELKLAAFKLGDGKMSCTVFPGNSSLQLPTSCGHGWGGSHASCPKDVVRGWARQAGISSPRVSSRRMRCWGLTTSLLLGPLLVLWMCVAVFGPALKASSCCFPLSERCLRSLKLGAEPLPYYIWPWCSWWKSECIYNAGLLRRRGLGTNVCLDKIQLQGLVLLLHVKSVAGS